ncbi:34475_t:CDS:2 [Gigaspora margarita]|uniref:34475_t:CDS:1 n=1 Tax=Gigaspora margarita TaxID=4874 RepID=A0ABN7VTE3_GIGMA|nr:34475_t:CDS:2 [Gigaspora margarita]
MDIFESFYKFTKFVKIDSISFQSAVECTKAVVEWLIDKELDQWFSRKTLVG